MNIEHLLSVFYKLNTFCFSKKVLVFILLVTIGLTTHIGATLANSVTFANNQDSYLEPVEGTSFELFEVTDVINFPATKKVYIDAVDASFSREWINKFRSKTSRSYRNKTLQKYAETFRSHLGETLTRSGWIVLNSPEEGAMKVSAKLFDVHINGPDTVDRVTALVLTVGSSGLELTIQDADEKIALHIKDKGSAGSPSETFIETNNAMNFVGFNKLFYGWANNLNVYLNILSTSS